VTIDMTGDPAYHNEAGPSGSPAPDSPAVGATVVVQLDANSADAGLRALDVIATNQ
jgi:hypothetical protein